MDGVLGAAKQFARIDCTIHKIMYVIFIFIGIGIFILGYKSRNNTTSMTSDATGTLSNVTVSKHSVDMTVTYTSNGNGGYTSVVTNGWLAYKATVDNVREGKLDDGTMKVQIDVRSDQLNPQRFNYLFEWYDAQGMKIDSATATWQNRFIKPQETITLSAVAPTRTCSRWVLKLSDEKQPFTPNN